MSPSRPSRRWPRRTLFVAGGSVVAAATLATWERSRGGAPWNPAALGYPDGDTLTVTTSDGAELAVTVAGPSDGPTVVLAHCWMGSRAIWGPVADRLVRAGHRVVLYDQRGHGSSTKGDRELSVAMLGDDLHSVLQSVNARDAVLAGHSMGGMTVQSYANEHPVDFKERTSAVVLVSTAARVAGRARPARSNRGGEPRNAPRWSSQGLLGYGTSRLAFGRLPRRSDVELTQHGLITTPTAIRDGFMAAMATMDLRPVLGSIDVPTTVLVGTRDLLTPPRLARGLAEGIPSAQLVVLPGIGHMVPLEAPDAVVGAIAPTG
ncbi:MAG: alpha/beta fold hydrolase [Acidimicrobiales bacterium]